MGELVERLKQAKTKEEQRALQIAFSGRGTKEEKLARGEQAAYYSQPTTATIRSDTDNWSTVAEQIYGDQRMAAYLKAANPGVDRFYRGMTLNRPRYSGPDFNLSPEFQERMTGVAADVPGWTPFSWVTQTQSTTQNAAPLELPTQAETQAQQEPQEPQHSTYMDRYGPEILWAYRSRDFIPKIPTQARRAQENTTPGIEQRRYAHLFPQPDNIEQRIGRTFTPRQTNTPIVDNGALGMRVESIPGVEYYDPRYQASRGLNRAPEPESKYIEGYRPPPQQTQQQTRQLDYDPRLRMAGRGYNRGTAETKEEQAQSWLIRHGITTLDPEKQRDQIVAMYKRGVIGDATIQMLVNLEVLEEAPPQQQVSWNSTRGYIPGYTQPYRSYGSYGYSGSSRGGYDNYGSNSYGGYTPSYTPYNTMRYATSLGPVRWRF